MEYRIFSAIFGGIQPYKVQICLQMVSFVDFDALGCSILEIFHFKAQKQQKLAKIC